MTPLIGVILGLCVYGTGVFVLLRAPRVRSKKLRLASRIAGVAALLPGIVALPAVLLGVALASGDPPAQTRVIASPHGDQATLKYYAGFLGRDDTEVTLKQSGCCQHVKIFWHAGPSSFVDPQIEWIGENHLMIRYHTRTDDPHYCAANAGRIRIECQGIPWPK